VYPRQKLAAETLQPVAAAAVRSGPAADDVQSSLAVHHTFVFGYLRTLTTWHCPPLPQQQIDMIMIMNVNLYSAQS